MATFGHSRADAARHQKRASQIDIDFSIPIVHSHAFDRMHLAEHAGRIDKASDRAVSGLDVRYAAHDVGLAGNVEPIGPQDRLRPDESFRRDIGNYDAPSLLREKGRGCGTDAAAATGYQNNAFSDHNCRFRYAE